MISLSLLQREKGDHKVVDEVSIICKDDLLSQIVLYFFILV